MAHKKLNTDDMVQRKRPKCYILAQWCVMSKGVEESVDHLFLHCFIAMDYGEFFFLQLVEIDWVVPFSCVQLLMIDFMDFGHNKKSKTLWSCIVCVVLRVIWLERNATVFEV